MDEKIQCERCGKIIPAEEIVKIKEKVGVLKFCKPCASNWP